MNKSVKFGTDGIRGHAENFPFTNKALIILGYSIAKWSLKKYNKKQPNVLIGSDTRISCERIKKYLIKGLLSLGLKVYDTEVLPTPVICKITNEKNTFDFGIIISASHNPYYDNGIKVVDGKTGKLKFEDEKIIENNFKRYIKEKNLKIYNSGNIQKWLQANKEYKKLLSKLFENKFLENRKIILDCANGSTYKLAPEIFKDFGANVITINNNPDGKNINQNCGALHTQNLANEILKKNADIGFAFDGDGDRVIAVNKNGETIDGDQIIALLSQHPKSLKYKTIVGTTMTNLGLDLFLKEKKINLIRTKVGDKYVAAKLLEKKLFLGGESSGHIIMTDYLNTGDGIFTALRIIQIATLNNNWNLKSFKKVPQILMNIPISKKKDLTKEPYSKIIKKYKDLLKKGRIIVRYSGTENLLRVMIEGYEEIITKNIADSLAKELSQALS